MRLLGYTSKGILILTVIVGVFLIFEFIAMNQIALATLILIGGLVISLSIVPLNIGGINENSNAPTVNITSRFLV